MEAYLPGFRKIRKEIVKNLPTDLSEIEIKNANISNIEVVEIKRLNMRNKFSKNEEDKSNDFDFIYYSITT